jgi:hypothetical protein
MELRELIIHGLFISAISICVSWLIIKSAVKSAILSALAERDKYNYNETRKEVVKMVKTIKGYCPTQGQEFSIDVNYIESTSITSNTRTYNKGLSVCDYLKNGNDCPVKDSCPLIESAPNSI